MKLIDIVCASKSERVTKQIGMVNVLFSNHESERRLRAPRLMIRDLMHVFSIC